MRRPSKCTSARSSPTLRAVTSAPGMNEASCSAMPPTSSTVLAPAANPATKKCRSQVSAGRSRRFMRCVERKEGHAIGCGGPSPTDSAAAELEAGDDEAVWAFVDRAQDEAPPHHAQGDFCGWAEPAPWSDLAEDATGEEGADR